MIWAILLYLLIGVLVAISTEVEGNPLLKLPICLLWPLFIAYILAWLLLVHMFIGWVKSVIEYYKEKENE